MEGGTEPVTCGNRSLTTYVTGVQPARLTELGSTLSPTPQYRRDSLATNPDKHCSATANMLTDEAAPANDSSC